MPEKYNNNTEWLRTTTRMYSIRIVRTDALYRALERAVNYEQMTGAQYIKTALVEKLRRDGYLTDYVELKNSPGRRPKKY